MSALNDTKGPFNFWVVLNTNTLVLRSFGLLLWQISSFDALWLGGRIGAAEGASSRGRKPAVFLKQFFFKKNSFFSYWFAKFQIFLKIFKIVWIFSKIFEIFLKLSKNKSKYFQTHQNASYVKMHMLQQSVRVDQTVGHFEPQRLHRMAQAEIERTNFF